MTRQQVWSVESLLATSLSTAVGGFGVVVQLMASAMLSAGKDLSTARKFTRMYALSLLCLTDAVGGRSIGD